MDIIVPYPNLHQLSQKLREQYSFSMDLKWSGNHLPIPKDLGDGSMHIFANREMQFYRAKWQFYQDTLFTSPDPVGVEKTIDFRIYAEGEAHSSFLEKRKKYEWEVTHIDNICIFIPEKFLTLKKGKLLGKFQQYCYDPNISRLLTDLFTLSPSTFEECIKLEWKFLELAYYWLDFLNKKDIARYFSEQSKQQIKAVETAKFLIESNLSKPIPIKSLSKKVGLNEQYLKKGFKQQYGYSIRQYIIQLRMEKAREMVLYENYSIGEISTTLGYSCPSHFAHHYQRFYGCTPFQHRINFAKKVVT